MPPTAAAADKAALRKAVLAARAAIPAAERAAAAEAVAEAGAALVRRLGPKRVSLFAAIRGEIDAEPLAQRLTALGVPLCLPVIAGRAKPLIFRDWRPGDALEPKPFGLLEPYDSAPEVAPDLLFVPLAAFDAAGLRLGYGGGFYDRTLEALRASGPVIAIGLAFAAQQVADVPAQAHDQPLDGMLTEAGIVAISGVLA